MGALFSPQLKAVPMRSTLIALLLLCFTAVAWAGIGSHDANYVGGTVSQLKDHTDGKPVLNNPDAFIFQYHGGELRIPYNKVDSLEYGQKAGRRVGLAVAVSPFFIFSHKRRHYLTVGYMSDDNKQQAAVLELGKGIIKETLNTFETKSGKKVEFQDDEARKSIEGK